MPQRETPQMAEAYREFLKLGIRRNYDRLHERLIELWGADIAPARETLKHWATSFGWRERVIADDEIINRRAMERIRDKLAADSERRRETRLQLSDIQVNAAYRALVKQQVNPDTLEPEVVPADLLDFDAPVLRAINDTLRLAYDTQRLDMGEATARLGAEDMTVTEAKTRAMPESDIGELRAFVGILNEDAPDQTDDGDDDQLLLEDSQAS